MKPAAARGRARAALAAFALVGMAASVAASGAADGPAPDAHATTRAYNVALGVECSHCHVENAPRDESKPTFDFARRMARMVQGLNEGPLLELGGVSCWSCHRGRAVPARLPAAAWQALEAEHAATFAGAADGVGITMSVYAASLGVGCAHCHVAGDWKASSQRAHRLVATMLTVFDVVPRHFDPARRTPRTQCYMCHQGSVDVPRSPG